MSPRRVPVAAVFVPLAALLCASCTEPRLEPGPSRPPTIVEVEGTSVAYSLSPMYGTMFGGRIRKGREGLDVDEKGTYVLVRHGEGVVTQEEPAFLYSRRDGPTLSVKSEAGLAIVNGAPASLGLGGEESGWRWLAEAPPSALASLRMVSLKTGGQPGGTPDEIPEDRLKVLRRLAEANPHLAVQTGDRAALAAALRLFDPGWLGMQLAELTPDDCDLLAAEPRLHTLNLGMGEDADLAFLSRLRRLRVLYLSGWKSRGEEGGQPRPLPAMENLRTLILLGGEMTDLAPLGEAVGMEELVIVKAECLADVGRLAEMTNLKALSLQGCDKVTDLSALKGLTRLEWLGLPPQTTQEQFEAVCAGHPDLVVLQAVGCEKITDLSPVTGLERLRVLMAATSAPLDPLAEVPTLDLLAVHTPKAEKKAEGPFVQGLVKVLEANPDLAVVEVSPLCLGSGWILLLAPLGAAAWVMARRRPGPGGRHA